jgi:hypothetical protein
MKNKERTRLEADWNAGCKRGEHHNGNNSPSRQEDTMRHNPPQTNWTRWITMALLVVAGYMMSPPNAHAYDGIRRSRATVNHGMRIGTVMLTNMSQDDLRTRGLTAPAVMLLGYEIIERINATDSVNLLFAQNFLIGGFEQSAFLFTLNAVVGLDIYDTIQLGVGLNISPGTNWTHAIMFLSWTPKLGDLYMPITASFVPDKDGYHRVGLTIGLSFSHNVGKRF